MVQDSGMANDIPFDRDQSYLLPPDLKEWAPSDDVAHFVIAATERVSMDAFVIAECSGGKPQYHPRLMLALLV